MDTTKLSSTVTVAEPDPSGQPVDVGAGLASTPTAAAPPVAEETLVEEVSIDGMCGVY